MINWIFDAINSFLLFGILMNIIALRHAIDNQTGAIKIGMIKDEFRAN